MSDKENSQNSPIIILLPTQSDAKNVVINKSVEQLENEFVAVKNSRQIIACYQLIKGEYKQNSLAQKIGHNAYKLNLFEQQIDENSYLVLTLSANSSQEAVNSEQLLKRNRSDP